MSDLDEIAWDLTDEDGPSAESYPAAFSRARAANAIWCAIGVDADDAADAVYEGLAALASADISPKSLLSQVGLG